VRQRTFEDILLSLFIVLCTLFVRIALIMKSVTALPVALLVVLLASVAHALYDSNSPVQLLDDKTFNQKVIKNDGLWYVEFFAPCKLANSISANYLSTAVYILISIAKTNPLCLLGDGIPRNQVSY
jgi:hypothetical protein